MVGRWGAVAGARAGWLEEDIVFLMVLICQPLYIRSLILSHLTLAMSDVYFRTSLSPGDLRPIAQVGSPFERGVMRRLVQVRSGRYVVALAALALVCVASATNAGARVQANTKPTLTIGAA